MLLPTASSSSGTGAWGQAGDHDVAWIGSFAAPTGLGVANRAARA